MRDSGGQPVMSHGEFLLPQETSPSKSQVRQNIVHDGDEIKQPG